MKSAHSSLLALAIAAALTFTACNRQGEAPADAAPAPDAATPADGGMAADGASTDGMAADGSATGSMATDPAAPPPMTPATGDMGSDTTPGTGTNPMTPPDTSTAPASVTANDRNADGGLSMDELPQGDALREHFSAADGDGNGMLSQAEIDKHNADKAAQPAQ